MNKTYYVYVHTLLSDGRKYIGITCQKPEERWRNGEGYKGSTHMYHAIRKYGWDAFSHEILCVCESLEEAYSYEKYYIAKYNTTNENFGFNCFSGGANPIMHWKTKERCSKSQKQIVRTEDRKEQLRKNVQKAIAYNTGKHRDEETKKKISESHKGMTYGEETKQKLRDAFGQPILCVELNQVYPSMTAAADAFGLSKCTISAVIKGRNKTAAGYHWKLV